MKKKLILVLDLETGIETQVSTGNEETDGFYHELLDRVANDDHIICDLYKLSLVTGFSQGHHILEMENPDRVVEKDREFHILKPVFEALSSDAQAYFLAVFAPGNTGRDRFFDLFFGSLGMLRIKKMNLIANAQSRHI